MTVCAVNRVVAAPFGDETVPVVQTPTGLVQSGPSAYPVTMLLRIEVHWAARAGCDASSARVNADAAVL
jgi:hypothetical protein